MTFYLLRLFVFVKGVNGVPERIWQELIPLGEHIRQRRTAEHLTQEELGEAVGVTGNTIHRIESAKHATKVTTVCRIAKALHTEPTKLFSDSPEECVDSRWEKLFQKVNTLSKDDQEYVFRAMDGLVSHLSTNREAN